MRGFVDRCHRTAEGRHPPPTLVRLQSQITKTTMMTTMMTMMMTMTMLMMIMMTSVHGQRRGHSAPALVALALQCGVLACHRHLCRQLRQGALHCNPRRLRDPVSTLSQALLGAIVSALRPEPARYLDATIAKGATWGLLLLSRAANRGRHMTALYPSQQMSPSIKATLDRKPLCGVMNQGGQRPWIIWQKAVSTRSWTCGNK
mmetsp:Transcript_31687/g.79980  ORF Transcript_31687/g.79980 Transcript_31687/m.79980 type:complete len:203 (+) Transcript_31687:252-860(+)